MKKTKKMESIIQALQALQKIFILFHAGADILKKVNKIIFSYYVVFLQIIPSILEFNLNLIQSLSERNNLLKLN